MNCSQVFNGLDILHVTYSASGGGYDMSSEGDRQRPLSLPPPPGYPYPHQQADERQWSMTGERGTLRPLTQRDVTAAVRRQSIGDDGDSYSYTGEARGSGSPALS